MFSKKLSFWEKFNIVLAGLFLIGGFSFLMFSNPSTTGYVPASFAIKDLDIIVVRDQSYSMVAKDSEQLQLNSVLASGKIIGSGKVKIYVECDNKKHLIYTNDKEDLGLIAITGAFKTEPKKDGEEAPEIEFISEEQEDLSKLQESSEAYNEDVKAFMTLLNKEKEQNDKKPLIDFIKEVNGTEFKDACEDTCALYGLRSSSYEFDFEVEPGTVLLLEEVVYAVEKK